MDDAIEVNRLVHIRQQVIEILRKQHTTSLAEPETVYALEALIDSHTREARIDENKRWQVVAEFLVAKDSNYRAVNYLNQRFQELEALNHTCLEETI